MVHRPETERAAPARHRRRVRTEFTFQGITGVYAYDGKRGWQISPLTGVVEPQAMEPENTQVAMEQADLEGTLVTAARRGATLALIGKEKVEKLCATPTRFLMDPYRKWIRSEAEIQELESRTTG